MSVNVYEKKPISSDFISLLRELVYIFQIFMYILADEMSLSDCITL